MIKCYSRNVGDSMSNALGFQAKENSSEKRYQCATLNDRTRKHAPATTPTAMSRIQRLVPSLYRIPNLPFSLTYAIILRILQRCAPGVPVRTGPQHDPLGWDADSGSSAV